MNRESRTLTLEPHTFVYNGFRWHIRAYSHEHQIYRDFVLARIIVSPELGEAALNGAEQDIEWQSVETLIIAPHPDLTPDQQAVIADDYGMKDRRLYLTVRRALILYYLRMLHLDEASGTPKTQQIIWLNRDQLEATATSYQYD